MRGSNKSILKGNRKGDLTRGRPRGVGIREVIGERKGTSKRGEEGPFLCGGVML